MSAPGIDAGRIERAAAEIDPRFLGTPQFVAGPLGDELGCRVRLKLETITPIRSFKGRGTDLLARTAGDGDVLACASAGNLGQGLAFAGRTRGLPVEIFAARDANPLKLDRMRALRATLHLVDGDFDAARAAVADAAEREGWRLVVDGRDRELAEGAGTIAVELTAGVEPPDVVIVPVGNGSLACGIASWLKAVHPATRVIAVGPAGAPAMERAWRTGALETGPPTTTIAEGLAARVPVAEAVGVMRATVDDFVLVEDERMLEAMRLLIDVCGLISEPSGAAGIAAALDLRDELRDATIAVPICGANVTREVLGRALA